MNCIRVINFPAMKMVSSGPLKNMEDLNKFDKWWSGININDYITPRDFMYFDTENDCMLWLFAPPKELSGIKEYEYIDFPGGLYAVSTCKGDDEADMDRVKDIIRKWISDSGCFEESNRANDSNRRYIMNHVVTPGIFKEKTGYHLIDIFIPIIAM